MLQTRQLHIMFTDTFTLYRLTFQLCYHICNSIKNVSFYCNLKHQQLTNEVNSHQRYIHDVGIQLTELTKQSLHLQEVLTRLLSASMRMNDRLDKLEEHLNSTNNTNTNVEEELMLHTDDHSSILSEDFLDIYHSLQQSKTIIKKVDWLEATKQFFF